LIYSKQSVTCCQVLIFPDHEIESKLKNLFTLYSLLLALFTYAQVCSPDGSNAMGLRPALTTVPCIKAGQGFSETYTHQFPTSTTNGWSLTNATSHSVLNLPAGLTATYAVNPFILNADRRCRFMRYSNDRRRSLRINVN
jgi:hypothetical protein